MILNGFFSHVKLFTNVEECTACEATNCERKHHSDLIYLVSARLWLFEKFVVEVIRVVLAYYFSFPHL